jgi:hypothetical protein
MRRPMATDRGSGNADDDARAPGGERERRRPCVEGAGTESITACAGQRSAAAGTPRQILSLMRDFAIMQRTNLSEATVPFVRPLVIRSALGRGAAVLCLLATMPLGGCIAVGGTSHAAPRPTLGQELVDLKRAADCGAISAEEYATLRSQAIHGTSGKNAAVGAASAGDS